MTRYVPLVFALLAGARPDPTDAQQWRIAGPDANGVLDTTQGALYDNEIVVDMQIHCELDGSGWIMVIAAFPDYSRPPTHTPGEVERDESPNWHDLTVDGTPLRFPMEPTVDCNPLNGMCASATDYRFSKDATLNELVELMKSGSRLRWERGPMSATWSLRGFRAAIEQVRRCD